MAVNIRYLAIAVVLVACSTSDTRVHLEVTTDPAWSLDNYQLRIGAHAVLAEPLPALDVQLPDDMAGQAASLEVWGLAAGQQVAFGMASVTPVLHSSVTIVITLNAVSCGTFCNEGEIECSGNGTNTCEPQSNGCLAWSAVTPCPSDTPYCSNAICAATCTDECTTGQTECDSAEAVRTCGPSTVDTCLVWSAPVACANGQTCSNGTCGTTVTCAQDGASCDDGNACTTSDTCEAGTCSGTPKCTAAPTNAMPTCDANGTCGFTCNTGYVPSGNSCVLAQKLVFVTSTTYHPDLGGLAGADSKCQARAAAAGLTGTYKAWLSDSEVAAKDRLSHSTTPYVLRDGTMIASDWTQLTTAGLAHKIDQDEAGAVATDSDIWSATYLDGTSSGRDCSEWTDYSSDDQGDSGWLRYIDERWTYDEIPAYGSRCDNLMALVCLEQ